MRTNKIGRTSLTCSSRRCIVNLAFSLAWPCVAIAENAHTANADTIAEHALAQQGFAIALASNVLQSHLLFVSGVTDSGSGWNGTCYALSDDIHSGGTKATASPPAAGHDFPALVHVEIFFDGDCAARYMAADVALTEVDTATSTTYSVTNLAIQYYAVDGVTPLASLTTTASVTLNDDQSLALHGLGHLQGAAGSNVVASLGLVCGAESGATALPCAGGIVQTFASLGTALGSVSPLTLTGNDNDDSLDFASTIPASFSSGAPGSLTLGYTDASDQALKITGGSASGSDQVTGHVAEFSLLPPPPTSWSASDVAHDLHFSISVIDATTRGLDVAITRISTNALRASGHVDQSGSGTITFSDGSSAIVRSWVMGDGSEQIFRSGFEVN
jgi:hypothetical protein